MSSAGGDGGDGGEEETRKIEARKIKDAERSRKRRADKKAKDEAETKKMKAMEVRMAEMEKSLESKDVKIAANEAGYQSLLAENQRLVAENSALKKNADLIIWDEVGDDQFERERFYSTSSKSVWKFTEEKLTVLTFQELAVIRSWQNQKLNLPRCRSLDG